MIGTIALAVAVVCGGRTSLGLNDGWWSELHPEKGAVRRLTDVKIPHNWEDYHDMRTLVHGSLHGSATYRRSPRAATRSCGSPSAPPCCRRRPRTTRAR